MLRTIQVFYRHTFVSAAACVLTLLIAGCGKSDSSAKAKPASDPMIDELFADIAENAPQVDEQPIEQPIRHASHETAVSTTSDPPSLTLKVAQGDRFSLVRSVSQTLRQKVLPQAVLAINDLQLSFDLAVKEVRADSITMNVVYRRVVYEHNIEGQQLSWDSASGRPAPMAVASYAAMVNQGFNIVLSRDNRIKSVDGYDEFIRRCVSVAPDGLKEVVRGRLNQSLPAADVADLVDSTIGLLPFQSNDSDVMLAEGDEWTREQATGDGSARIRTSCRLRELTPLTAEIAIRTRIAADDAQATGSSVRITGGEGAGTCLIDCRTGLPITSERTQSLTLVVPTAKGTLAEQEKLIRTTVRSRFEPAVLTN